MAEQRDQVEPASATIWDWQSSGGKHQEGGTTNLRRTGLIQGATAAVVASLFLYLGLNTMATIAYTVAAIVTLAAILSPNGVYATLSRGADKLGLVLSNAVKWICLPAVYYLFFLPFGTLFRRGAKDTLKRAYLPDATTYWVDRQATNKTSSRRKQF